MRRLLLLLAVLCGFVWAVLLVRVVTGPETRDMAQLRTIAGVLAFVLGAIAATARRRK
jgi:uncharacterized membrane protein YcaP (DUF421 family)